MKPTDLDSGPRVVTFDGLQKTNQWEYIVSKTLSTPRKASSTRDSAHSARLRRMTLTTDDEISLVCEALRMMAEQLVEASAVVNKVMPEAHILERFADWREQADALRERLERS